MIIDGVLREGGRLALSNPELRIALAEFRKTRHALHSQTIADHAAKRSLVC